jgi:hypothetical protein
MSLLFVAPIMFAGTPEANATITQALGGPGGSPFKIECPGGKAVAGFFATAGAWVDGVSPLCAAPGGKRQQFGWAGGTGGGPQMVYCPDGDYVTSVWLTFTRGNDLPRQYVNTIGIICGSFTGNSLAQAKAVRCIYSDDAHDLYVSNSCESTIVWSEKVACPKNEVLTGIVGRSGNYVDAMGAVCGPAPKVMIRLPRPPIGPPSKPQVDVRPTENLPPVASSGLCKSGYVWREASPDDHVCVTPQSRDRIRVENGLANIRRDPNGAYGPNSCKAGFVWREAYPGDIVCVEPEIRDVVRDENSVAASHRQ